jgi:hypothetical protein
MAIGVALLASAGLLRADGGALLARKQTGDLIVSVFGTPTPLRIGSADLSVMVQQAGNQSAVMDAKVLIHLVKSSLENVTEIVLPARHSDATNKLLYAAKANLTAVGLWKLQVDVEANQVKASATAEINVYPAQPALVVYWRYFALVPLCILAFALNRWLRRRTMVRTRPVQP